MTRLEPAGFFALRTPLLPLACVAPPAGDRASGEDPAAAYECRASLRREALRALVREPVFRDALFVASPDLDNAADAWLADPGGDQGRRAERSLVRYTTRMAARATPFGLFAGCSVGEIGAATAACLGSRGEYKRHTRLDMEYLAALIAELELLPEVRSRLTYHPNTSTYRAAGRVRYVEAVLRDRVRHHRLVAVEDSDYLHATLERAREGSTIAGLAASLVADDVSLDEATAFVHQLIDSQLLVSDLEPRVTRPDALAKLIHTLGSLTAAPDPVPLVTETLLEVARRIDDIDAQPLGDSRISYRDIAHRLERLPAKVELPRLFQVDMTKPVRAASLGPEVIRELERGVHILHALTQRMRETPLDRFRERFVTRYEMREVPLNEVLDEEVGIGFDPSQAPAAEASPLLRDLAFPARPEASVPRTRVTDFLTRKLSRALRDGAGDISITTEEAEGLAPDDLPPLPPAFAVTATLAASGPNGFRAGDFTVLVHAALGPSGARMLGRFCAADPNLEHWVRRHLAREESFAPDAIFAEVVHLPEGRVGNIVQRPVLRAYEIPYLARSAADENHVIPVSDLVVTVRGDRVVLRSRRLDREVVPRMTSAHNYQYRAVGTYGFLCALQSQGVSGQLAWDWGPHSAAPYLPRVVSGRLVLCRARWNLTEEDIKALDRKSPYSRFTAMQQLRARLRLPARIVLSDADNELLCDLDDPLAVETLVHLVHKRGDALLTEAYPPPDRLWVEGPEGSFVSEVIVPFHRAADGVAPQPAPPRVGAAGIPVQFPPGSEWLYLKIYCGTSTADALLRDLAAPLVREATAAGIVDRWFFIRYGDPDWHLRLRLHGDPAQLVSLLVDIRRRVEPLLADASVARLAVDTYEPEMSRYGGAEAMPLVESVFEADSRASLEIVELLSGDAGMDARWRLALRGVDMLFEDLGVDLPLRQLIVRQLRDAYRVEFRADAALRKQIGQRFREETPSLLSLMRRQDDEQSDLAPGFEAFARRSERTRPPARELRALASSGRLTTPHAEIAKSLAHMHVNRVLRSAHRAQELVLYDFLDRIYASLRNRR